MIKIRDNTSITPEYIINKMAEKNISCRFGIQPLHQEPFFDNDNWRDEMFPVSCRVAKKSFFIPIFPGLSEDNLKFIVENLKQLIADYKS